MTAIGTAFTCGLIFGVYLNTAAFANRWLIFVDEGWKLRRNFNWFLVIVTNLIFAGETTVVGILVNEAFHEAQFLEVEGHKLSQYINPQWFAITACTLTNTISLLADTVLMYRLWVVYAKKMSIVWLPIFLWIGGIVCTVLQLFLQVKHVHNPNFGPYHWAGVNMSVGPGIVLIPFWGLTIIINAYCTGFLIWKIWSTSKKGENNTASKQLQFVIRTLMESGILYLSISLVHFFAWFSRNDDAIHFLGAINVVVIGTAFNFVIIRTAQKRAEDNNPVTTKNLTSLEFRVPVTTHTASRSGFADSVTQRDRLASRNSTP